MLDGFGKLRIAATQTFKLLTFNLKLDFVTFNVVFHSDFFPCNHSSKVFCEAFDFFEEEFAFRICGDSPLIDPKLIDKAYQIYIDNKVDLITNLKPRTFPNGQSVELISKKGLNKLKNYDLNKEEIEHVTLGFYHYEKDFKIINFISNFNISNYRKQTIDSYEDFLTINHLIKKFNNINDLDWFEISNKLNYS